MPITTADLQDIETLKIGKKELCIVFIFYIILLLWSTCT